jgi:tumor protein p53-inducible protein 3
LPLLHSPDGNPVLGLEAAGIILESKAAGWSQGDHVMALLPSGGNAEYVTVPAVLLMRIPAKLSFIQAGAIPETWLTAFQLLSFVGKAQKGQIVLIHAGASGVGTAAIQLAVKMGLMVLATGGSEEKLSMMYALGATQAVSYKAKDWVEQLRTANPGGVDLVLDCVGGAYWEANIELLKTDGTWVLYGLMGGAAVNGPILGKLMKKRIRLEATTLRARALAYKADLVAQFSAFALEALAEGTLRPVIDSIYPLAQISDAHAKMLANKNAGKIVLTMPALALRGGAEADL